MTENKENEFITAKYRIPNAHFVGIFLYPSLSGASRALCNIMFTQDHPKTIDVKLPLYLLKKSLSELQDVFNTTEEDKGTHTNRLFDETHDIYFNITGKRKDIENFIKSAYSVPHIDFREIYDCITIKIEKVITKNA